MYIKNDFGIVIVKRCASCEHKKCDSRLRICMKGHGSVRSDGYCDDWEMFKGLKAAGSGLGQVKSKNYLYYSINKYFKDRTSPLERRKEYLEDIGGIYEDI